MDFNSILFVAPNYKKRKGGIASVLTNYKKNIQNFNFFPSAYFSSKWLNFSFLPFTLLCFIFYLIINPKIKIVHIHGASRGSFYRKYFFFFIAQKVFHKKVIYHIHGGGFHLFYKNASKNVKCYIERMIDDSDSLIVLSQEWEAYFRKTFQQKNIRVINNIVEKQKEEEKQDIDIITLLFLGKIGSGKGIYDLLNAIVNNREKFKNKIQLVIGGDGEVNKLLKLIKEYELESIVSYIGWVSGERKKQLFKEATIMILPSYKEGLPISLLEAMSYSMPIISTNVGGIPQILEEDINGKLVEPGNTNAIKEAIFYYINNKDQIKIHGKSSYNKVQSFFPKNVIQNLSEIYSGIN